MPGGVAGERPVWPPPMPITRRAERSPVAASQTPGGPPGEAADSFMHRLLMNYISNELQGIQKT
jgi:hypothetical protein